MNRTFHHPHGRVFFPLIVLVCALLQSCAPGRSPAGQANYLQPAGWQNIDDILSHDSFAGYALAVEAELTHYRVPVFAGNAMAEIAMASPVEVAPAESCDGVAQGIAILVHGLSDTAFAMRDVASVLSESCFKSRTVLLPGH